MGSLGRRHGGLAWHSSGLTCFFLLPPPPDDVSVLLQEIITEARNLSNAEM